MTKFTVNRLRPRRGVRHDIMKRGWKSSDNTINNISIIHSCHDTSTTMHYLPHDQVGELYKVSSYMGTFMEHYQPPAHDDVCLAIAMPRLHVLDQSTNKTNVYGSCIIETCLDVTFFTCPDHYLHGTPPSANVACQAIPLQAWDHTKYHCNSYIR